MRLQDERKLHFLYLIEQKKFGRDTNFATAALISLKQASTFGVVPLLNWRTLTVYCTCEAKINLMPMKTAAAVSVK